MLFNKILDIFRKENLLMQAYELSYKMLEMDLEMFKKSVSFLRKSIGKEFDFDIYAYDKKINEYERDVRKKVMTHLAFSNPTDVAPSLILISIIINIERIGDYTKNISELAVNYPMTLEGGKYEEMLENIETNLTKNFKDLISCFKKYNIKVAKEIMDDNAQINKKINDILDEMTKEEKSEFSTREGIVLALYFRFLKRISSHVKNVASSIVNPFHKIGFKAEEIEGNLK
ncbi:PhoU domain-containing protein [candidate division KSB1 bacterium]